MVDYYTPVQHPANPYGYIPGNTYMINGYRMYLHGNYWYYVDYPQAPPLKAARTYYRTGGTAGRVAKILGVMLLITGIGLMFGDGTGFVVGGAFCLALGLFGTTLALYDSMRNHPTMWKAGATIAVAAYAVHSLTDDD